MMKQFHLRQRKRSTLNDIIKGIERLKEVLQTCWEQIGQDVIDHAIGQFRKRLSLVVATGGGHIEHRFDLLILGTTRTLSCLLVDLGEILTFLFLNFGLLFNELRIVEFRLFLPIGSSERLLVAEENKKNSIDCNSRKWRLKLPTICRKLEYFCELSAFNMA